MEYVRNHVFWWFTRMLMGASIRAFQFSTNNKIIKKFNQRIGCGQERCFVENEKCFNYAQQISYADVFRLHT